MKIFISAGEPSGDLHAANLVKSLRKLRPDAEFVGYGGPKLQETGAEVLYPLVNLAVMWFGRVLLNIRTFMGLVDRADAYFREHRPDAVVLIDYPGLHWHIARKAKENHIPVFYFVPPQIWAWANWRVNKMRKYVDHVLCSLPFEPEWYHERNVPSAVFVGHPYFDELTERVLDESFVAAERSRGGPLVAILPGSRTQEVTKNFPTMLRAAEKLARDRSDVRFAVACLHERHQALVRTLIQESGIDVPLDVHAARTAELIRVADVAWAVSGSVSLELMMEALPSVVLYKMRAFDLFVARFFIKSDYIGLVNVIAKREVMPEYLTHRDVSDDLADWAKTWLDDPSARERASASLAVLRAQVAIPGACDRAAGRILEGLAAATPSPYHGPHQTSASGRRRRRRN